MIAFGMRPTVHMLLVVLAALTASCAVASDARISGHKDLVTYVMPSGWNNERFANGRHYQRADDPDNKAILAVMPEVRDEYMTLEQTRTGRTGVHEVQGHKQVYSAETQINEFEVWESIYAANIRGDDVIMHDFMMFSATRVVEVHLIAGVEDYQAFLPDLRAVVASVQVN